MSGCWPSCRPWPRRPGWWARSRSATAPRSRATSAMARPPPIRRLRSCSTVRSWSSSVPTVSAARRSTSSCSALAAPAPTSARSTCGPESWSRPSRSRSQPPDVSAAYTRLVRRKGTDLASITLGVSVDGAGVTQVAYGSVGPRAFLTRDESGVLADPTADPDGPRGRPRRTAEPGRTLATFHPSRARLPPGDAAGAGHARP